MMDSSHYNKNTESIQWSRLFTVSSLLAFHKIGKSANIFTVMIRVTTMFVDMMHWNGHDIIKTTEIPNGYLNQTRQADYYKLVQWINEACGGKKH